MKCIAAAIALLLSASSALASKATLIDHDDEWNLFTKFEISAGDVADENGLFGGLTIGGYLNDRLGVGIAAHVLIDSVDTGGALLGEIDAADLIYGGAYLEYVFNPYDLVNVSLDLLTGMARLEAKNAAGGPFEDDVFFVEPGLNVMINITETFHFGIGAGYRFAGDLDTAAEYEDALTAWNGSVFLRFTEF